MILGGDGRVGGWGSASSRKLLASGTTKKRKEKKRKTKKRSRLHQLGKQKQATVGSDRKTILQFGFYS